MLWLLLVTAAAAAAVAVAVAGRRGGGGDAAAAPSSPLLVLLQPGAAADAAGDTEARERELMLAAYDVCVHQSYGGALRLAAVGDVGVLEAIAAACGERPDALLVRDDAALVHAALDAHAAAGGAVAHWRHAAAPSAAASADRLARQLADVRALHVRHGCDAAVSLAARDAGASFVLHVGSHVGRAAVEHAGVGAIASQAAARAAAGAADSCVVRTADAAGGAAPPPPPLAPERRMDAATRRLLRGHGAGARRALAARNHESATAGRPIDGEPTTCAEAEALLRFERNEVALGHAPRSLLDAAAARPPIAVDDAFAVAAQADAGVVVGNVLANDCAVGAPRGTLFAVHAPGSVRAANGGSLQLRADGTFHYSAPQHVRNAPPTAVGAPVFVDSFVYALTDGGAHPPVSARVTLYVSPCTDNELRVTRRVDAPGSGFGEPDATDFDVHFGDVTALLAFAEQRFADGGAPAGLPVAALVFAARSRFADQDVGVDVFSLAGAPAQPPLALFSGDADATPVTERGGALSSTGVFRGNEDGGAPCPQISDTSRLLTLEQLRALVAPNGHLSLRLDVSTVTQFCINTNPPTPDFIDVQLVVACDGCLETFLAQQLAAAAGGGGGGDDGAEQQQ